MVLTVVGGVSRVVVEVEDQERAKRFWTETFGFELVQDTPYGDERWLEVRTPDKAVVVVLDVRKGPRPTHRDPSLPTSQKTKRCRHRHLSCREAYTTPCHQEPARSRSLS
jgi:catechol 2,3-dioxygenase-like lactoylglutathione lyase family enzyme